MSIGSKSPRGGWQSHPSEDCLEGPDWTSIRCGISRQWLGSVLNASRGTIALLYRSDGSGDASHGRPDSDTEMSGRTWFDKLPIVALTAEVGASILDDAMKAGANWFLKKTSEISTTSARAEDHDCCLRSTV
jgi:hypothetical protein